MYFYKAFMLIHGIYCGLMFSVNELGDCALIDSTNKYNWCTPSHATFLQYFQVLKELSFFFRAAFCLDQRKTTFYVGMFPCHFKTPHSPKYCLHVISWIIILYIAH